jgi:hypothetical protein
MEDGEEEEGMAMAATMVVVAAKKEASAVGTATTAAAQASVVGENATDEDKEAISHAAQQARPRDAFGASSSVFEIKLTAAAASAVGFVSPWWLADCEWPALAAVDSNMRGCG